jgi:hypothetical protein
MPVSRTCIEDTTRSTKITYYFDYTQLRIYTQIGDGLRLCVFFTYVYILRILSLW